MFKMSLMYRPNYKVKYKFKKINRRKAIMLACGWILEDEINNIIKLANEISSNTGYIFGIKL
jgi:hypothetical protein